VGTVDSLDGIDDFRHAIMTHTEKHSIDEPCTIKFLPPLPPKSFTATFGSEDAKLGIGFDPSDHSSLVAIRVNASGQVNICVLNKRVFLCWPLRAYVLFLCFWLYLPLIGYLSHPILSI
jgi:hypothetical protein